MAIPSLMEKSFSDIYDEFLFACSHGDYLSVERLLHDGLINNSDISRTMDQQKFSPIIIAIEHNHFEVIKILLDYLPYNDFREALLLAIYLDLTKIAQLIMEHDTFKCFYGTFADWQTDTVHAYDDSHFAAIRPIQLAAQYNRTTILYNFLQQGLDDSLRYSQLRLSTYRGLSAHVYLALVSQDPINAAFDISTDLAKLIKTEPNFRSEYQLLWNQVSHFTAHLLDYIQNPIEVEFLLTVERLKSAIEHNQQEFITHTYSQQRLTDIWYHNIDRARSTTLQKRLLALMYYFIIYLPMYIGYFWLPCCFEKRCQWYFQQAAIQTLLHTVTYQLFVVMLILSYAIKTSYISFKIEYPQIFDYCNRLLSIDERPMYCQRNIMSDLKIIILIWIAGYIYRNVSKMIRERRCLEMMELFTTILFIMYFFLFNIAAIQVYSEWQSILNIEKWKRLEILHNKSQISNEYIDMVNKLGKNCILRNRTSDQINVQIIADGVFTLILVCCIIHLCLFLLISEYFGPLLLSLSTTSKTIYRWFIFIFIFLFAYHTSFLHLLSYYFIGHTTNNIQRKANISVTFGSQELVAKNIFLSLLGILQNELTKTYSHTHKNSTIHSINDTINYFLNPFTTTVGSLIYGSFAFGARIILITMIIAYIKRLYNINKEHALNNWKFARAKFYMTFISKDPDILPVPFNLIPTPRHLRKFFQKHSSTKKHRRKHLSQRQYLRNLNNVANQYNPQKKPTMDEVMNCIVLRFLTEYHPCDIHSLKRSRQIQYKEEFSQIRHYALDEIQTIQQSNQTLNKQISTVFFQ